MKSPILGVIAGAFMAACLGTPLRAHAAAASYSTAVAADAPIAHWRFNESSGPTAADASGHGHNGSYLADSSMFSFSSKVTPGDGRVTFVALGSGVQVPNATALNPAQITIEAVFSWHGPVPGVQQRIVEKSMNASATEPLYGLNVLADGRIMLELRTSSSSVPQAITTDPGVVPKNAPVHLTATYDGANANIYLNGVLKKTQALSGNLLSSTQPVVICNRLAADRACHATLDELAIFSSALSNSRIQAHRAETVTRVPIRIYPTKPDLRTGQPPFGQFVTTTFPVQVGVPIPEGTLYSGLEARVVRTPGAATAENAETKVLGRWRKFLGSGTPPPSAEDIPIKWLQVSFNADVALSPSPTTYYLEYGPGVTNPALVDHPNMVTEDGDGFLVNTGALKFRVTRASPKLLDQVWVDIDNDGTFENNEIVVGPPAGNPSAAHGLYFVDQANNTWRASNDPHATLQVEPNDPDSTQEDPDLHPQQVTLKATGRYRPPSGVQDPDPDDDNQWIVRIKAYAGKPFIRVYHTIVFNESSADRRYRDIGVELRLPGASNPAVRFAQGYDRPVVFKPDQPEYLDYDQWFTPLEVTGTTKVMLHQARHLLYRIHRLSPPPSSPSAPPEWSQIGGGFKRAGHWFDVSAANGAGAFGVTAALRGMWQNYPNALEWEQTGSEQLVRMHLWTRRASATDGDSSNRLLDFRPVSYLKTRGKNPAPEVGAGALQTFKDEIYCRFPPHEYPNASEFSGSCGVAGCMDATGIGLAKTHEMTFEFHRNALTPGPSTPPETAFFLQKPVIAHVDPQWLRDSLALGRIYPKDPTNFPQVDGNRLCSQGCNGRKCKPDGTCQSFLDMYMDRFLLEQVVDGQNGTYPQDVPPDYVAPNGESSRAWGDSYGAFDFGDVLHSGKRAHRYWLHNRYYTPSSFWLWFARSGDRRAYEFGENNSRHVMDLDTSHTQRDFSYATCGDSRTKRMFPGTPRGGDLGAIHWASSSAGSFGCARLPPPNQSQCDPSEVHVPLFTGGGDYASYLATYYYLTGYERARDVALEVATFITRMANRRDEEYWTQSAGRGLGVGLQAVSDLYALFGSESIESEPLFAGQWLETAASKIALELIEGAEERAASRVCPQPGSPEAPAYGSGVAYGFGTPLDSDVNYTGSGMVAYHRVATATSVPTAAQASQWLRDQVNAIAVGNLHGWPNTAANHWSAMAAAFHDAPDPAAKATVLAVGQDEFQHAAASGWDDLQDSYGRAFTFYGLPYLMDAVATAAATAVPVVARREAQSSGAELQFYKTGTGDAAVTLRAETTPAAEWAYPPNTVFPTPPFNANLLPPKINVTDGGPLLCRTQDGCSASIVVYDPNGNKIESQTKPYRAGFSNSSLPPGCTAVGTDIAPRSRTWYNGGGWVETINLIGGSGVYRARVEVDGVMAVYPTIPFWAPTTVKKLEYNKPLYQLFVVKNDPQAQVMAFAGSNEGLSPGFRYPTERRQWFYMPPAVHAGPVQFSFDYYFVIPPPPEAPLMTLPPIEFPLKVYRPGGGQASVSGGGDNVPFVVTVPSGERQMAWSVDLGPEWVKHTFGFDHNVTCSASEPACKTLRKWGVEFRVFTSSGIYPFYADSPANVFPPVPLWGPQLLSPSQVTTAPPPSKFEWRAVAGAERYKLGWQDGAHCAANYEILTAEQAHCAFGAGTCWVQRPIYPGGPIAPGGQGQWFVSAQRDEVVGEQWSATQRFRYGQAVFSAPTSLQAETQPQLPPTLSWNHVAGATHYEVQVDDASSSALKRRTYAAAGNCNAGVCEVSFSDPLAPGSAMWWVHANCSGNYAAGQPFPVN